MTKKDAVVFMDNLIICIKEHPVLADWLVEIENRKTGNCSEKPNNCETCKFEIYWPEMCEGCCEWDSHYEPKTELQTIRCPKCGRSDYIREFGKDFSVTAEEAGFKYKCINCNTYIEPQSDRIPYDLLVEMDIKRMVEARLAQTDCDTCRHRDDIKSWNAKICDRCDKGSNWEGSE